MDTYVNQQQDQNRRAHNGVGSVVGAGVEMTTEGLGEVVVAGVMHTVSSTIEATSSVAGDIAESSIDVVCDAGTDTLLECAAEAGGTVLESIVEFIGGIFDAL